MMPLVCAWRDCKATCEPPPEDLPPGWICLVTFRKTRSPLYLSFVNDQLSRDAVLCPVHADGLEGCLKRIRPVGG